MKTQRVNPFSYARTCLLVVVTGLLTLPLLHDLATPLAASQSRAPLDLLAKLSDVNGLGFNPRWAWQLEHDGVPNPNQLCFQDGKFGGCTTDPVEIDEPKLPYSATCFFGDQSIKGHINWRPVTYTGTISWGEYSLDGDYCFELSPDDQTGGLTTNRSTLHLEFSGSETVRHFETPWWKRLYDDAGWRGTGSKKPGAFLNGKRAIVTGLFGLDCVHGCYSELHPVYAIAINVATNIDRDKGTVDEVWAIFARNWGGEGWCSQKQYQLKQETELTRVSLLLPWRKDGDVDALTFENLESTKFLANVAGASGPDLSSGGNQGILVSFSLPKPEVMGRVHGDLHLRWRFNGSLSGQPAAVSATTATTTTIEHEEELLYQKLGVEGRKKAAGDSGALTRDSVPMRATVSFGTSIEKRSFSILNQPTEKLIIQPAPPRLPLRVESVLDAEKEKRDRVLLDALGIKP